MLFIKAWLCGEPELIPTRNRKGENEPHVLQEAESDLFMLCCLLFQWAASSLRAKTMP